MMFFWHSLCLIWYEEGIFTPRKGEQCLRVVMSMEGIKNILGELTYALMAICAVVLSGGSLYLAYLVLRDRYYDLLVWDFLPNFIL